MNLSNPDWAYKLPGPRDLRLDWLRGYATMAMVIDHIGSSSYFHIFTGGNVFYVSAAEAFVFISGLIVGVVYGDTLRKEGWRPAARKALLRAWTLYKLTVVLTVAFVFVVVRDNLPWAAWLNPDDPAHFLLSVLTLRKTFVFVDIPLMYTLLMLLAPLGLLLCSGGHRWLLLAISWAVWFAYQLSPIQTAIPPIIEGNWIFKIPAWQLLFFNAMVIGYQRDYLSNRLRSFRPSLRYAYFVVSAVLFVVLVALYLQEQNLFAYVMPEEQSKALLSALFDKAALAPGRLIAALIVFQFAFLVVTFYWHPLARLFWLIPMGQNSLYAYTLHIVLLVAFYLLIPFMSFYDANETLVNTFAQVLGITFIYVMIRKRILFKIIPR